MYFYFDAANKLCIVFVLMRMTRGGGVHLRNTSVTFFLFF